MKTVIASTAVLLAAVSLVQSDEPPKPARGTVVVTDAAKKLHADSLVVDGHNDLPWELRSKSDLSFTNIDLTKPQKKLHTDLPRLKAGGMGAQFWSAYVPADSRQKGTAIRLTLEQIDVIHRMVAQYPDHLEFARTADDILRIRKAGKIASLIGVEGGHSIDNSLAVLRAYYTLGVRYMTLTHSKSLDWADSATDKPVSNGLSPFGETVVLEMNRLGMLVDISHVSAPTMHHVLRIAKAPVIASHSSAYALANHPRNVPDDVLVKVKENGGVIMVNFFPGFIFPEGARAMREMAQEADKLRDQYPDDKQFEAAIQQWLKDHPTPRCSVHTLVDHIEHIIKVAGEDHVGLGSDYDGIPSVPIQLEDVSKFPVITQELLNRGHPPERIKKVLGLNLLRALREAENVARKFSSD